MNGLGSEGNRPVCQRQLRILLTSPMSLVATIAIAYDTPIVRYYTVYSDIDPSAASDLSSPRLPAGRQAAESRRVMAASRVGSLFEEDSPYHQAALQGLRDANSRAGVGRPLLQAAALVDRMGQTAPTLDNVTLITANISGNVGVFFLFFNGRNGNIISENCRD